MSLRKDRVLVAVPELHRLVMDGVPHGDAVGSGSPPQADQTMGAHLLEKRRGEGRKSVEWRRGVGEHAFSPPPTNQESMRKREGGSRDPFGWDPVKIFSTYIRSLTPPPPPPMHTREATT